MPCRGNNAAIVRGSLRLGGLIVAIAFCSVSSRAQTLTTLYDFQGGSDGAWPCSGLVRGSQGRLYGTTQFGGGKDNAGTVFELSLSGNETVLHRFHIADGQNPCSSLFRSSHGDFYGTTIYGGVYGTVFRLHGNKLTVLHEFTGNPDGAFPVSGVIEDATGVVYGTTGQGGTGPCSGGCGTIYRIDQSGNAMILHSFNGPDGAGPSAGLIMDSVGSLYGTTRAGGANQLCPQEGGCGTVFKLDANHKLTLLHSFVGGADGWAVGSGLVSDAQGNLYGTTLGGGTSNMGTVYEVTKSGKERILHSFTGAPDGADPAATLFLDSDGLFYGTTYSGGDVSCVGATYGCGTIFQIDKSGNEKVLYSFNGSSDGAEPTGNVIPDSSGNLYGTTSRGPEYGCPVRNCGTMWKLEK
jgi:uncharacterized repeat protein (TIGR03803 family)